MLVPPFRVVLKTPVDSALHLSITMASADFCAFSTAFGSGYVFQRLPHRPPWVPHVSFTPSTCLIYPMRFRVAIGFHLALQTYPRMRPYMRFLFVRPELCPRVSRLPESSFLQILPRGRHPCLQLCPSHYRADSGLTPVRNVRRQAHNESPVHNWPWDFTYRLMLPLPCANARSCCLLPRYCSLVNWIHISFRTSGCRPPSCE